MSNSLDGSIEKQKPVDFVRVLEQQGFKLRIPPDITKVQRTNYSEAERRSYIQSLESTAYVCRKYLSMFLVEQDPFRNDHNKRREWRHAMDAKYGESFGLFFDNNKLRFNNLGGLRDTFQVLVSLLDRDQVVTDEANGIRKLLSTFPPLDKNKYAEMEDSERREMATTVGSIARAFLELTEKEKVSFASTGKKI